MTCRAICGFARLGAPLHQLHVCQGFTLSAPWGCPQHRLRLRQGLGAFKEERCRPPKEIISWDWGLESPAGTRVCASRGVPTPVAGVPYGVSAWTLRTPYTLLQRRFVARVKVHRFAGVVPLKVRSPKSEWYIQAEKEFLSERDQVNP